MPNEGAERYRAPSQGMLHKTALVQDWSICVLDALQTMHFEKCSAERPMCPVDRYCYASAIEAAGIQLRSQIEWYAERFVDARELAIRIDPRDIAMAMFVDVDKWMHLSKERH